METDDKKNRAEEAKRERAEEAIREASREEIQNFAEEQPNTAPNAFWGQSGTWWIIGIAGILIIFLIIWLFFV